MIAQWAIEADSVHFPALNGGRCFIHRLAFRALLGRDPSKEDCITFVTRNQDAIANAAGMRAEQAKIGLGVNFHLNSRHLRRATIWQVTCMLKV